MYIYEYSIIYYKLFLKVTYRSSCSLKELTGKIKKENVPHACIYEKKITILVLLLSFISCLFFPFSRKAKINIHLLKRNWN